MNRLKLTAITYIIVLFSIFLLNFYGEIYIKNIFMKYLIYIIYFVIAGCSIKYVHQSKRKVVLLITILLAINFFEPIVFVPQFVILYNLKFIQSRIVKVVGYLITGVSIILFIALLIFTGISGDERKVENSSPNGASRIVMRYHDIGAVSSGYKEVTVEIDVVKNYIVMSRKLYAAPYRSNISITWKDNQNVQINDKTYSIYGCDMN